MNRVCAGHLLVARRTLERGLSSDKAYWPANDGFRNGGTELGSSFFTQVSQGIRAISSSSVYFRPKTSVLWRLRLLRKDFSD